MKKKIGVVLVLALVALIGSCAAAWRYLTAKHDDTATLLDVSWEHTTSGRTTQGTGTPPSTSADRAFYRLRFRLGTGRAVTRHVVLESAAEGERCRQDLAALVPGATFPCRWWRWARWASLVSSSSTRPVLEDPSRTG